MTLVLTEAGDAFSVEELGGTLIFDFWFLLVGVWLLVVMVKSLSESNLGKPATAESSGDVRQATSVDGRILGK